MIKAKCRVLLRVLCSAIMRGTLDPIPTMPTLVNIAWSTHRG